MTRWKKIWTVTTFEFLSTVKRPGYLIATFGMPVFMAAYVGVVAVPAYYADKKDREPTVYGVVDHAGVLSLSGDVVSDAAAKMPEQMRQTLEATGQSKAVERALAMANFVFRPIASDEEARRLLGDRTLKGAFVIPSTYLADGVVTVYAPDTLNFSGSDARRAFGDLLRQRLVTAKLDRPTAERILTPIARADRHAVTRTGELRDGGNAATAVRFVMPLVFMFLFLISILMTSGYLMQGTATEKENKVVEVLLASANPDEILAGKLLGLGGAGLLQIAVWLIMVFGTGLGIIPLLMSARVEVPWTTLALAIPFFVVAFLFYGGLMLGTGSLGSNMREAQQLAMVWSLTAALPLMLLAVLMREPNGTIGKVLTWVPFTAGPLVILRSSTDAGSIAWWEIAGSFALLLASTWLALRLGARLFRIGLLSSGARPSLREIWRQARLAG